MSVIYLYGFVPEGVEPPEGGLLGVEDTLVERVAGPGLAAVVSRVDDPGFSGEALERNCGDVEWMARQGMSHEQVVAWFVDHATILPSKLLTLFSAEDALRQTMEEDGERLRSDLDRFAELREWDLRVGHDPTTLMDHLGEVSEEVARLDRAIEEATPGKRFLLERKRGDVARTEGRSVSRRLARELLESLRPVARDTVTLDPPSGDEPVSLSAALLVERSREAELAELVRRERERLERVGVTIRFTGPWAPYRFMGDHAE